MLTTHYEESGMNESRLYKMNIPKGFIPIVYYELNKDLWDSYTDAKYFDLVNHYITNGHGEGRKYQAITQFNAGNYDYDYFNVINKSNLTKSEIIRTINQVKSAIKIPLNNYIFDVNVSHASKTKTLILSHSGGGGVEKYMNMLLQNIDAIILVPNCDKDYIYELRYINKPTLFFGEIQINKLLNSIMLFKINKIIINHSCLFSPQILLMVLFIKEYYDVIMITIVHDFSFISPVSNMSSDEIVNVKHTAYNRFRQTILEQSKRVIFPSNFIKHCHESFYDMSAINTMTVCHPDIRSIPLEININASGQEIIILIFGHAKGLNQINNFIRDYNSNHNIIIHYIGNTFDKIVATHRLITFENTIKSYDDSDIVALGISINPSFIWFPSLIPESYCYALSYALLMSYPIVCYGIGAFPERLKGRNMTYLLEPDMVLLDYLHKIVFACAKINNQEYADDYHCKSIDERTYMKLLFD
jgi:hypothetical protein